MKKKVWIAILLLGIAIVGFYSFIKFRPPLEISTLASSEDKTSVVVGVGNKGFRDVKILDVSVNNDEKPTKTKVQVSNALQGFILTDNFNSHESKKYGFRNIEDTVIKAGTSPSIHFEKLDDGTATKKDKTYGVSVTYNQEIFKVDIKYNYLGFTFKETVSMIN